MFQLDDRPLLIHPHYSYDFVIFSAKCISEILYAVDHLRSFFSVETEEDIVLVSRDVSHTIVVGDILPEGQMER